MTDWQSKRDSGTELPSPKSDAISEKTLRRLPRKSGIISKPNGTAHTIPVSSEASEAIGTTSASRVHTRISTAGNAQKTVLSDARISRNSPAWIGRSLPMYATDARHGSAANWSGISTAPEMPKKSMRLF